MSNFILEEITDEALSRIGENPLRAELYESYFGALFSSALSASKKIESTSAALPYSECYFNKDNITYLPSIDSIISAMKSCKVDKEVNLDHAIGIVFKLAMAIDFSDSESREYFLGAFHGITQAVCDSDWDFFSFEKAIKILLSNKTATRELFNDLFEESSFSRKVMMDLALQCMKSYHISPKIYNEIISGSYVEDLIIDKCLEKKSSAYYWGMCNGANSIMDRINSANMVVHHDSFGSFVKDDNVCIKLIKIMAKSYLTDDDAYVLMNTYLDCHNGSLDELSAELKALPADFPFNDKTMLNLLEHSKVRESSPASKIVIIMDMMGVYPDLTWDTVTLLLIEIEKIINGELADLINPEMKKLLRKIIPYARLSSTEPSDEFCHKLKYISDKIGGQSIYEGIMLRCSEIERLHAEPTDALLAKYIHMGFLSRYSINNAITRDYIEQNARDDFRAGILFRFLLVEEFPLALLSRDDDKIKDTANNIKLVLSASEKWLSMADSEHIPIFTRLMIEFDKMFGNEFEIISSIQDEPHLYNIADTLTEYYTNEFDTELERFISVRLQNKADSMSAGKLLHKKTSCLL